MSLHIVIIGAGPAGLTAAYLLAKQGIPVTVLEADPVNVGGIAKTVNYKGYSIDIGGHRFFSKSAEIEAFWDEILPDDMLERPRSSRIFYQKKFFAYPLNGKEVLTKLGIIESCLCFLSYLKAKLFPIKPAMSFADWVINHFGNRLFRIFFKTYTEKVWGMPCHTISADWAAQRIKGLSLSSAIWHAFFPQKKIRFNKKKIKTLIHTFRYPRKGPGMLWERCRDKIHQQGGKVLLNARVFKCVPDSKGWEIYYQTENRQTNKILGTHLISSASLRELICQYIPDMPAVSPHVFAAAKKLQYRDFLIVALIVKDKKIFNDNWIYIHDPSVSVARIQHFKSWSPDMVPDSTMCCYGMEYFCSETDDLWQLKDTALIQKASTELIQIGLATPSDVLDGHVIRQYKAYPVYTEDYQKHIDLIREFFEKKYPNLFLVGRNGMHKYNNQDHAMMTAMLTVKNIIENKRKFNVWCVNQDAEYHEQKNSTSGLRDVPQSIKKEEIV